MKKQSQHILTKFGFEQVLTQVKPLKQEIELKKMIISVIKPIDHINPQFVVKINRDTLIHLNWEITDRVIMLANKKNKTVALMKTNSKDKNSFAISAQGSSVQIAKELQRGGIVKIGWRDLISTKAPKTGSFDTEMEIFENTLLLTLPQKMFEI
jgi:hypothetical protein